jgi:hypothetical protein
MIEIKDLLFRVQNILFGEETKRQAVLDAIFLVTGIKISTKDIKIKNGAVFLNTKPIFKNEIFIKKEKILEELKKNIRENSPKEIR